MVAAWAISSREWDTAWVLALRCAIRTPQLISDDRGASERDGSVRCFWGVMCVSFMVLWQLAGGLDLDVGDVVVRKSLVRQRERRDLDRRPRPRGRRQVQPSQTTDRPGSPDMAENRSNGSLSLAFSLSHPRPFAFPFPRLCVRYAPRTRKSSRPLASTHTWPWPWRA